MDALDLGSSETFRASKSGLVIVVPLLVALAYGWWWLTQRTGDVLDVILTLFAIILGLPFLLGAIQMVSLTAQLDPEGLTHGRRRVIWDDVHALRLVQVTRRDGPAPGHRPRRAHLEVFCLRAGRLSRVRLSWFVQGPTGTLPERFLARLNRHRQQQGLDKAVVEVVQR